MIRDEDIISLFSYSEHEQELFPFAREYMGKVRPRLQAVLKNPKAKERFMLAGLYTAYLAANHTGSPLTTEFIEADAVSEGSSSILEQRLQMYKRFTGHRIDDTEHYLNLIRFSLVKFLLLRPANMLYIFVRYGL